MKITANETSVVCHGEAWRLQYDSSGIGHCWEDCQLQGLELLEHAREWPTSHEGQAIDSLLDMDSDTEFQIDANHYRWV